MLSTEPLKLVVHWDKRDVPVQNRMPLTKLFDFLRFELDRPIVDLRGTFKAFTILICVALTG
jgi:hypothetical protein